MLLSLEGPTCSGLGWLVCRQNIHRAAGLRASPWWRSLQWPLCTDEGRWGTRVGERGGGVLEGEGKKEQEDEEEGEEEERKERRTEGGGDPNRQEVLGCAE